MRRVKAILIGLVAALIANGLAFAMAPGLRSDARRWLSDWRHPLSQPGFSVRTIADARGQSRKYCLFVPHTSPPRDGYPTILYLNGFGENGDDGIAPLYNALAPAIWERQHEFPCLVVFAQCHKGESWTRDGTATQWAFAILNEIRGACPLDPDRLYVTGVSAGATGAWVLGEAFADRVAAVAAVSSGPDSRLAGSIAAAGLPCWGFSVRGDSVADSNRDMCSALIDAGASPRFTELDGTPRGRGWNLHNSWDYAFQNPALYEWLLRQRQSANTLSAAPFRRLFADGDPSAYHSDLPSVWEMANNTVRCAANPSADSRLETTAAFREFDLHFEFRCDERPRESSAGEVEGDWAVEIVPSAAGSDPQGLKLTFRSPERGPWEIGQLPEKRWLADGDAVAARSFRPGEWNDLRVRVERGHIHAELNGWRLFSAAVSFAGEHSSRIGLSVPGHRTGSIEWRDVRVRERGTAEGTSVER